MTARMAARMADGVADEAVVASLVLPDLVRGFVMVSFFIRAVDIK